MPSEWIITLEGPPALSAPVDAPHAVVSRWLDTDHRSAVKPYSILPPTTRGNVTTLVVRLLDDSLGQRLLFEAQPGSRVRLGRHHLTITAPPMLREAIPWSELAVSAGRRSWLVRYVTPVTFRRRQRTSPWPAPESVLTSLASRWSKLRPDDAPVLTRQATSSVWVSDIDGHSELLRIKDNVVSGFVGRVRYVCDGDDADTGVVGALFAFARYAGIGSHTAYGLGAIRLEDTRQPAPRVGPGPIVGLPTESVPTAG